AFRRDRSVTEGPALAPSRCDGCGALILFVVSTKSGKLMPVDTDPTIDGNVLVRPINALRRTGYPSDMKEGTVLTKASLEYVRENYAERGPLYMPHFATCPKASRFKR